MGRSGIKSPTSSQVRVMIDKSMLRSRIIEEHQLRMVVARDEEARRESPEYWRWKENIRLQGDRADVELNRKLREAGCRPVRRSLTLAAKVKKLQQLEARNRAEIATLRADGRDSRRKPARHTVRSQ